MLYAEMAYFDGDHCSHCARWQEEKRSAAITVRFRQAYLRRTRNRLLR